MSRQHLYTGKSGQLAVMAEFVSRGYNVAVPEVDLGDDLFVIRDRDGKLSRVQVKTANAKKRAGEGFGAAFKLPLRQLQTPHIPDMNYVFAVRYRDAWCDFLLISRQALYDLHAVHGLGKRLGANLLVDVSFSAQEVTCSEQSLQQFRNDWSRWPPIIHGVKRAHSPGQDPRRTSGSHQVRK